MMKFIRWLHFGIFVGVLRICPDARRMAGRSDARRGMGVIDSMAFGASGLDRAAHLRGDAAGLMQGDCVLALWRGKPLMQNGRLVWLGARHGALAAGKPAMFLGLDAGQARFAQDVSAWVPAGDVTTVGSFADPSVQIHPDLPADMGFTELRGAMMDLTLREAELAATARALSLWHATHGFCATCGAASAPAMAGWQRDCVACGAHHFPRTDPVVIMLITHGNRILLGRSPGWPEGMYSCLAGFVEPGETIEGAVRREVLEEAGITVGDVRYVASQPWPFPASLMLGCVGEAVTDAIRVDPAELEDALWLTREDMVSVMVGEHPRVKPARKGAIAHFLIANWLADRLE
jgi:NAD+ diphosphatase